MKICQYSRKSKDKPWTGEKYWQKTCDKGLLSTRNKELLNATIRKQPD